MMRVTTKSLGLFDNYYGVAWRVGTQRKGIIYIQDINIEDPLAAAELVTIKHLLFVKNILKREILSGEGILLELSCPVIKKIYRGKTTKTHLVPYAHFMQSNLTGVSFSSTAKNDKYLPNPNDEELNIEHISADDNIDYNIIDTPALGKIIISSHVIDQYAKRLHSGTPKKPIISLKNRIMHPELSLQKLPEKVLAHKLKKYGSVDELEVWGHESSQMHFVVIRDHSTQIGTIVTLYRRHQAY